jgi:telomerase reverse transcriptase
MGLFFVSVDIEKCYDGINQNSLLELVESMITQNTYVVKQLKLDKMSSRDCLGCQSDAVVRYKKVVTTLDSYQPFHACQESLVEENRNTIFDLFKSSMADRNEILVLLKEHIKSHMVVASGRHQRKVLLQSSGISQGSVLSTTLCNLYYGMVEKRLSLNEGEGNSDNILARFVDDFIFISPNEESVRNFLAKMYRGIPELGAQINANKTVVNSGMSLCIEAETGERIAVPVRASDRLNHHGRVVFPWCGLLFDPRTGDVSMDYGRFYGGKIRDSLTVDYDGSEGKKMEYRMQNYVLPRCLPILYDPLINSFEMIVLNFYQMMLFAATKTVEHLRSLVSYTFSSELTLNVHHIVRNINGLSSFATWTIRRKVKNSIPELYNFRPAIDRSLASWLTWNAFHKIFSSVSDFNNLTKGILEQFEKVDSLLSIHNSNRKASINPILSKAFDGFHLNNLIQK